MRNIHSRGPCLGIFLASALASGCISLPAVYGENWAAPERLEGNACPAIDGDYQNAGEQFDSGTYKRTSVSLAYLLGSHEERRDDNTLPFSFENPAEDAYQTVNLRRDGDRIHVIASRVDGSQRSFEMPVRGKCRDSMLPLGAAWDSGTVLVASMVGRSSLSLGRTEDGALLVHQKDAGMGVLFYVPIVAGTSEGWTLFPPVAAPGPAVETRELTAATPAEAAAP